MLVESETFLGEESTYSDDNIRAKEEFIARNEIFGIKYPQNKNDISIKR